MGLSRRDFGKIAWRRCPPPAFWRRRIPNSAACRSASMRLTAFTASTIAATSASDAMVKLNLSSVELRAQPIEQFMGAPANLVAYPPAARAAQAEEADAGAERREGRTATRQRPNRLRRAKPKPKSCARGVWRHPWTA